MRIIITQVEMNYLNSLISLRLKQDEEYLKSNSSFINAIKSTIKSLKSISNKLTIHNPIDFTFNESIAIQSCINPELQNLFEIDFLQEKPKEAIEWLNIDPSILDIINNIDILESVLSKINKKYKSKQYFKIFELIESLTNCEKVILSKCDSYFYKIRFVKNNYDIFQIGLTNVLNIENQKFGKSTKTKNSNDLRNTNVSLLSKDQALYELSIRDLNNKYLNKNTLDFVIKILSE